MLGEPGSAAVVLLVLLVCEGEQQIHRHRSQAEHWSDLLAVDGDDSDSMPATRPGACQFAVPRCDFAGPAVTGRPVAPGMEQLC